MAASSTVNFFIRISILLVAVNYGDSSNTAEEMQLPRCSRMCNTTRSVNKTNVPLFMCSCSPSCSTFGDCCYDSDYRSKTSRKKIDFICLSVSKRGDYKVVAGCPANQHSNLCKSEIGISPPVTSRVTNTTYANKFCAKCNGDKEDLATWNVELRCAVKDGDAEISFNDYAKIEYGNGHLWKFKKATAHKSHCKYHVQFDDFTLLDSLELRFCFTEGMRSTCSPQWKISETKELCRSYEDPVYFDITVFRNLHCSVCNYMIPKLAQCLPPFMEAILRNGTYNPSVLRICAQRGPAACVKYLSDMVGKGWGTSFSNLFNILEEDCIPDDGERCCPHEQYDYRSKRCRKIAND